MEIVILMVRRRRKLSCKLIKSIVYRHLCSFASITTCFDFSMLSLEEAIDIPSTFPAHKNEQVDGRPSHHAYTSP
jgi:hypothetical protein